jgi:GTPase SAR1 family protein
MVDSWFQELYNYSEGIKIVLVGNKSDLPPVKLQVKSDDAKKLAQKYGATYFSASALNDVNINEIFSTLAVDIYHAKRKKEKEGKTSRRKSLKLLNIPEGGETKKSCC